jgi:hypothetical protein
MKKSEDNPDIKVLKTATCPTLTGKSTLTYQIGLSPESIVHLRISKNSGGGFFSDEWIALDDILATLKKLRKDTPITAYYLSELFQGKSVNTPSFLLSVLKHLKVVRSLPKNKRHHELLDPMPFLDQVTQLMDAEGKTGGTTRKASSASTKKTGGSAAVRKAAITKKAMPKRRTAKTV